MARACVTANPSLRQHILLEAQRIVLEQVVRQPAQPILEAIPRVHRPGRYETRVSYGDDMLEIRRLCVAEMVSKQRVGSEDNLGEALGALHDAVTEKVLDEQGAVSQVGLW